jgi:hypothetical protein
MACKLKSVKVVKLIDEISDCSDMGQYTHSPSDWAIVRTEGEYLAVLRAKDPDYQPAKDSNRYTFFIPADNGEVEGSEDWQKHGKQDFKRAEDMANGLWQYLGVRAEAEIVTSSGTRQHIRTAGLFGIESDSQESYFAEVGAEELEGLRSELAEFGIEASDWQELCAGALKSIELA